MATPIRKKGQSTVLPKLVQSDWQSRDFTTRLQPAEISTTCLPAWVSFPFAIKAVGEKIEI
jgi:hypothetical protein